MAKKDPVKVYSVKKSWKKILQEVLIWGVPQVVVLFTAYLGQYSEMTLAALLSAGGRWLVDWVKHKG